MAGPFRVFTTRAFDRNIKQLVRKDPDIPDIFEELLDVLASDPLNITRRHQIKKLTNVAQGDGQWRIRSGVYRLRYDVDGRAVTLHSINHRSRAY